MDGEEPAVFQRERISTVERLGLKFPELTLAVQQAGELIRALDQIIRLIRAVRSCSKRPGAGESCT